MIITPELQNILNKNDNENTIALIKEAFTVGQKDGSAHHFVNMVGTADDIRDRLDNTGIADHLDMDDETVDKIADLDDDTIQRLAREVDIETGAQDTADDLLFHEEDFFSDFFESLFRKLNDHVNK